jgi:RecA/RadA recombinase
MRTRQPKKKSLSNQLAFIASDIENLKTMNENLEITKYIPTIIPGFNRAIVVGGAPLGCIWTLHGEYAGGKSTLAVELIVSFIEHNHLAVFIDAEHAASKQWFEQLGADPNSFLFYRPDYMEDATDQIDQLIENFDSGKAHNQIDEDKGMIIVVDSVNKLTPKAEYDRFKKEGSEALEKGLARHRGLMLQSWLDHMTPIIGKRNIALVCIAQERIDKNAKPWEPQFTVKGCQGLMYDSTVQGRVWKGKKITEGDGKKKVHSGQEHRCMILKNKIGFPLEKFSFFTSNGKGRTPIGFDLAKTAVHEAIENRNGIVTKSGGRYYYRGDSWHGEWRFLEALREDIDLLNDLCIELNEDHYKTTNNVISDEESDVEDELRTTD